MEKTFVDWFLLDIDSSDQTFFTKQILSYLDDFCDISSLNAFEICLLFEIAFKKGDAKHIKNARVLATQIVTTKNKDETKVTPEGATKKFDLVLTLSDLDADNNGGDEMKKIAESQMKNSAGGMMKISR